MKLVRRVRVVFGYPRLNACLLKQQCALGQGRRGWKFLGTPITRETSQEILLYFFLNAYVFQGSTMTTFPLVYLLAAAQIAGVLAAVILAYYAICYLTSPLKDIPGPALAKFTNLWRVHDYIHLISPETQKKLHAKHGVAVRLGPNLVALNDPALIPVIYNARGTFRKVRNTPIFSWHLSCNIARGLSGKVKAVRLLHNYTSLKSLC